MPVPQPGDIPPRRLLRDQVRDELLAAILDGTLEPGERLVDDDLVEWLGCSRTPIREALNELAHEGFVEIEPNKHTRVALPLDDEAIEVVQTLGVLYGGAVRLAVPRLDEGARRRILSIIDAARADIVARDGLALNAHTTAFFDLFVESCGNPHLQKVCRETTAGLAFRLRLPNIVQILDFARLDGAYQELRNALEAGDPVAAELAAEAMHQLPVPVPTPAPVPTPVPVPTRP